MIPLIFVFKSKINVYSETKIFGFFQFQKYDETFESRKLFHNEIMYSHVLAYNYYYFSGLEILIGC